MNNQNEACDRDIRETRFAFGSNWKSFLSVLDDKRIEEARLRLCESLGRDDLHGVRVLDVGSGSGLSSLVMHQLGAEVVSFDYDADSVACTRSLRETYAHASPGWEILQGSALDSVFMAKLGTFDLVYSWGVLHHTGAMWPALELVAQCAAPGGSLLIALYNDQGWRSRLWHRIKRVYCGGTLGRWIVSGVFFPVFGLYALAIDLGHLDMPGEHARRYRRKRGMSLVHDWRDWLGGYPFEVAKPEDVERELSNRGFRLVRQTLTRGLGCNEFVFYLPGKSQK